MKKYLTESIDLLEKIKGRTILRMVRLFCGDANRFLEDFSTVREKELFAYSGYAFFIYFESVGWLAFTEHEREISVMVSHLEELPALKSYSDSKIEKISGQKYIECSDERYSEPYWQDFIGRKITELKIISLSIDRKNVRPFRNERGLWIVSENGTDFLIQTSLATKGISGGLNLIKKSQLNEELQGDLVWRDI